MTQIIERPSPNFDSRNGNVDMLLFHYTDMPNVEEALQRLCDPQAQVSAHYLIDEAGGIYRLVAETHRAWHAGKSYWAGATDINARSIGIELSNPGHSNGYRDFPKPQMQSLIDLTHSILARHSIAPTRILGHSDVAPMRKRDPGELFDWKELARQGIGLYPSVSQRPEKDSPEGDFFRDLISYGYDPKAEKTALVQAFCRHFRPASIVSVPDPELRCLARALIDASGLSA